MPTQALASNNPARESRAIYDAEEFSRLVRALPISGRLQHSYETWVLTSTGGFAKGGRGARISMYRSVKVVARAVGVCETTMRSHIRQFEQFRLADRASESEFRTNVHVVNIETLRTQNFPGGLCPRCNHKHLHRDECGCALDSRVWRRDGCRERHVQRTCRCAPAEVLPPKRRGPQRVENSPQSSPPSPTPVQAAAPSQPSPAAPARVEHAIEQTIPQGKHMTLNSRSGGKLIAAIRELVKGCEGVVQLRDGSTMEVQPGHRDYRKPLSKIQALFQACWSLGIPYWSGKAYAETCGWKFDESEDGP
jgi:hypothetical protein